MKARKTVETVFCSPALICTQLKQGVNEKAPFMSQPCPGTNPDYLSLRPEVRDG
jgi:hypothetical protein